MCPGKLAKEKPVPGVVLWAGYVVGVCWAAWAAFQLVVLAREVKIWLKQLSDEDLGSSIQTQFLSHPFDLCEIPSCRGFAL